MKSYIYSTEENLRQYIGENFNEGDIVTVYANRTVARYNIIGGIVGRLIFEGKPFKEGEFVVVFNICSGS